MKAPVCYVKVGVQWSTQPQHRTKHVVYIQNVFSFDLSLLTWFGLGSRPFEIKEFHEISKNSN